MRIPKEFGDIYRQATLNIGDPPHAEAYCRCLAMEIERLTREDERQRIIAEIESAETVYGSMKMLKDRVRNPKKGSS